MSDPYIYRDNAHWLELKTNPTAYSALVVMADKLRLTTATATDVEIDGDTDSEADLILRIDQVFNLFIQHNETGAILFILWITDPS